MGFISGIFGYLLNWLYEVFSNYGVAILIFSVILRVILIPITIKQQKVNEKNQLHFKLRCQKFRKNIKIIQKN